MKSYRNNIYVTDEYKLALELLNLEIEKQRIIQDELSINIHAYEESLMKQIELLKQKCELQEQQLELLERQIKSENFNKISKVSSRLSNTGIFSYNASIKNDNIFELTGINKDEVEDIHETIFVYQNLRDDIPEHLKPLLDNSIEKLKSQYPHLVVSSELSIDDVAIENELDRLLLEVYNLYLNGHLRDGQIEIFNLTLDTKRKLDNLKEEYKTDKTFDIRYREMSVKISIVVEALNNIISNVNSRDKA